ncbi:MAG TPA: cobalamin-independent methionine synthase II family protein [Chitinophagaceae bacterium]|nr:cobalamin-independent methionine synthase II family protein [Chitinophagaceae bacterium]
MQIPTEPIGSIPRPKALVEGLKNYAGGKLSKPELDQLYHEAVLDTLAQFAATGSPVISDGEQTKPSFVTYPIQGMENLDPDGILIPFADGHTRQLPRLTGGPFKYRVNAVSYYKNARKLTNLPLKQAVISASALSLLYPPQDIRGYSREAFLADLVNENEADIRYCLESGAEKVQIDFTEGRLAVKLDPSRQLLKSFIALNNQVLERFSDLERKRIGVHACPGADHDSTHSADVDYTALLPLLFELQVDNFYLQFSNEKNKGRVLASIRDNLKPGQRVFIGVTDVCSPIVETPEDICHAILEASAFIPFDQLGTTDDCGFSPFADDESTGREIAFQKIRARVEGTRLAGLQLK